MYKLVFLDMDDTLLNSDKTISQENIDTIRRCHNLGVKFVIATGRPRMGIDEFINMIPDVFSNSYASNFNGGMIYDLSKNQCIIKNGITGADVKRVYEESKRLGVHIHSYDSNQKLVTPLLSQYTARGAKLNRISYEIIDFDKINDDDEYMKAMMVDDPDKINYAIEHLDPAFYKDFAIFRSSPYFLEFVNKKGTKGEALVELANHLNIPLSETIAFGDSENDLSMIKKAGLGIAMANSYDLILPYADFITKTNNEAGVAYALKKFILNEDSE